MARPRSVPDETVHDAVLSLLRGGGAKAVTFGAVAERAGLAASSLAQRHGSIAGMIRDAEAGAWGRLMAATEAAALATPAGPKGAVALLKVLAPAMRGLGPDGDCADLATAWRERVEAELAGRLGGGSRGRETAALLFAAWQGQIVWAGAGGRMIKLKDMVRRLAG